MFVTSEKNRLPSSAVPFEPEGAGVWGGYLAIDPAGCTDPPGLAAGFAGRADDCDDGPERKRAVA
ncbi:hypothetical protein HDG37_007905 [Paraburkholderia sp. MM5384-R2]|nr:hypothetical protein [Paraburkholderia sp. MM5384-R2]